MSDDGPEWFAPKRYGFGAGRPISWQGWAITIGFIAISIALALLFRDKPLLLATALVPVIATLLVITARTTRGGWRWRWGRSD
jgi:hypothetical protein